MIRMPAHVGDRHQVGCDEFTGAGGGDEFTTGPLSILDGSHGAPTKTAVAMEV